MPRGPGTVGRLSVLHLTSNCNSATCAPAFVAQPQNQTVAVGQTATFTSASAICTRLPTYQWYENNVVIADAIV